MYEENKADGDMDSERGSFHEYYRLQKLMQNIDEDVQLPSSPNEGYMGQGARIYDS